MSQLPEQKESSAPIFIVGSARSGTSIVTRALMRGAEIPGDLEGCFIDILGLFLQNTDVKFQRRLDEQRKKEIMLSRVPQEAFKKDLAVWFRKQYEQYMTFTGRWIDKTPDNDAVYGLEYMHFAWPEARFIIMKRRPIENIASRLRKFPHIPFENNCTYVAQVLQNILKVRKALPVHAYIEIDQYDIAKNPGEVAKRLGVFLNLPMSVISKMEDIMRSDRPEYTGGDEDDMHSLETLPWTSKQKEFFRETVGDLSDTMGWSLDEQYYKHTT